jgi:hypothetical protein
MGHEEQTQLRVALSDIPVIPPEMPRDPKVRAYITSCLDYADNTFLDGINVARKHINRIPVWVRGYAVAQLVEAQRC